ncbi:MAG: ribonuclease HII [Owenweeksia sp.]
MSASLLNFHTRGKTEAGCDEAGRGCLAGPVVAAAVILPPRFNHPLLNDSKQMTKNERNDLRLVIEKKALAWAVSFVDHKEIDALNILNASFLAMHRAVDQLQIDPDCLLIDGNRFNAHKRYPHYCIIKGDGKFKSIAAASVLAKTHRDEYMEKLAVEHPCYQWESNKGYPTRAHREAIRKYGLSPYHRKSFRQLPGQLPLNF